MFVTFPALNTLHNQDLFRIMYCGVGTQLMWLKGFYRETSADYVNFSWCLIIFYLTNKDYASDIESL